MLPRAARTWELLIYPVPEAICLTGFEPSVVTITVGANDFFDGDIDLGAIAYEVHPTNAGHAAIADEFARAWASLQQRGAGRAGARVGCSRRILSRLIPACIAVTVLPSFGIAYFLAETYRRDLQAGTVRAQKRGTIRHSSDGTQSMRAWIAIAMQRSVRQRAIKMAAVVGTILVVINQWDILVSGPLTTKTLIKIGLTFLVPYCVSTFASVQAIRHLLAGDAGDRTIENGARESGSRRSS